MRTRSSIRTHVRRTGAERRHARFAAGSGSLKQAARTAGTQPAAVLRHPPPCCGGTQRSHALERGGRCPAGGNSAVGFAAAADHSGRERAPLPSMSAWTNDWERLSRPCCQRNSLMPAVRYGPVSSGSSSPKGANRSRLWKSRYDRTRMRVQVCGGRVVEQGRNAGHLKLRAVQILGTRVDGAIGGKHDWVHQWIVKAPHAVSAARRLSFYPGQRVRRASIGKSVPH